jgi:hypothetical protein
MTEATEAGVKFARDPKQVPTGLPPCPRIFLATYGIPFNSLVLGYDCVWDRISRDGTGDTLATGTSH